MNRLCLVTLAAWIATCQQTENLAGEISIADLAYQAADIVAWQQPSALDDSNRVTIITIAAHSIDRDLAANSLNRFGFFAPDSLHLQLTVLNDGQCQSYDVGNAGSTGTFWTGKSVDLDCDIQVENSQVSGSVKTGETELNTPLTHGFDLDFQTNYLQWN